MSELELISGGGRGGRVTKRDILGFVASRSEVEAESATSPLVSGMVPMDAVRRKVAEHMRRSLDTAAHAYAVVDADVTALLGRVASLRPGLLAREGFKLTASHFVAHATTRALQEVPEVNSSLVGDGIVTHQRVNLGMATATDRGLLVPVLKEAEGLNLLGLARAVDELVTRTRDAGITPDDVSGSTFTITNYGVFGQLMGFPIINQPNAAILGVGAFKKQPVVVEHADGDAIAIRSVCLLTLSFDHRIIDGDVASRFLNSVKSHLEAPPDG